MDIKSLFKAALLSSFVLLAACNTAPKTDDASKPKTVELSVLMDQAGTTEKSGTKAAAIAQYEEAAKLYPSSKLPWAKIAQIQFDALNYGEAIVAAQQVVARDEKDKVAHSILSVSGLRVSTKALADLSRQNELTGSVKSEAQTLARLLRESLGERVLVPTQPADTPRAAAPAPRPAAARPSAAPAKPADTPSKGGGNPFGALQ